MKPGSEAPAVAREIAEVAEIAPYELDDIDDLRDQLQSNKQLLELEIQAKLQLGKENRDLKCQMITMEAEIETLKAKLGLIPEEELSMVSRGLDRRDSKPSNLRKSRSGLYKSPSIAGIKKSKSRIQEIPQDKLDDDEMAEVKEMEEEINSLKSELQASKRAAAEWEAKAKEANQTLLVAKGNLCKIRFRMLKCICICIIDIVVKKHE